MQKIEVERYVPGRTKEEIKTWLAYCAIGIVFGCLMAAAV